MISIRDHRLYHISTILFYLILMIRPLFDVAASGCERTKGFALVVYGKLPKWPGRPRGGHAAQAPQRRRGAGCGCTRTWEKQILLARGFRG